MAKTKKQKSELNDELEKAIAALKTQCKDSAFFDKQIDRILSLKGQADVKPVRVIVEEKDVVREFKGETYWIALTDRSAIYHTYGGYTIIADLRNSTSLYMTIAGMLDHLENPEQILESVFPDMLESKKEEEGRELLPSEIEEYKEDVMHSLDADVEAKMYVLNAPTWCFTDIAATYDIATNVVSNLNVLVENAQSEALKEEDHEANADFEDAMRGIEHIGKIIEEDKEGEQ